MNENKTGLYFVFTGKVTSKDTYIDRLPALGGTPEIIAAFPEREEAVKFALSKDVPAVVVERRYSLQGSDDNNLISRLEFEQSVMPEEEKESEPEPEPELNEPIEGPGEEPAEEDGE